MAADTNFYELFAIKTIKWQRQAVDPLFQGLCRCASHWDDAGGILGCPLRQRESGCPSSCSPLQTPEDDEETLLTVETEPMAQQFPPPAACSDAGPLPAWLHPTSGSRPQPRCPLCLRAIRPLRRQCCSAPEPLVYSPALQSQTIKEEKQLHRHSPRNGFMCKSAAFKISLSMKVHL